jgi:hypothetical protein
MLEDFYDFYDMNPPASPERLAMAGRRFERLERHVDTKASNRQ